jgi:hypothetical protein
MSVWRSRCFRLSRIEEKVVADTKVPLKSKVCNFVHRDKPELRKLLVRLPS